MRLIKKVLCQRSHATRLDSRHAHVLAILVGSLTFVAGCRSEPLEKVVPVTGKVTLNGEPARLGSVMFSPDKEKGCETTTDTYGTIDAEGNYEIASGLGETLQKGSPLGWFRVVVEVYKAPATQTKPATGKAFYYSDAPPTRISPDKYGTPKRTPLAVEVVENPEAGAYDLVLTSD